MQSVPLLIKLDYRLQTTVLVYFENENRPQEKKERLFLLGSAAGQSARQLSILHLPFNVHRTPPPSLSVKVVMFTCIHDQ